MSDDLSKRVFYLNMTEKFVSRAGQKLQAALEAFGLDVRGLVCADFGCNVGGFTDCLLQAGAEKVFSIDTGYGELAWKLRKDPRVVVMERTNALHCPVVEQVDLVVIDVAWTPQIRAVPAAMKWLKPGGLAISLLKPHYEMTKMSGSRHVKLLTDEQAQQVCLTVCQQIRQQGAAEVLAAMKSVLRGKGGNIEFLLLLALRPDGA